MVLSPDVPTCHCLLVPMPTNTIVCGKSRLTVLKRFLINKQMKKKLYETVLNSRVDSPNEHFYLLFAFMLTCSFTLEIFDFVRYCLDFHLHFI